jgi:hypothetical protein
LTIKINGRIYFSAGEAAKYLAKKWGMESYSTAAFQQLRLRHVLEPDFKLAKDTLWLPETLDKIPKPSRNNPRKKKPPDEDLKKAA